MTTNVAATSGRTPKWAGSKSGDQFVPVKKSIGLISEKNSIAGNRSDATMPSVVMTEMSAQTPSSTLITASPTRALRRAQVGDGQRRSCRR